ncbi:hypothetical protein [Haloarchaeobius sp. HRN-SO-5]|uniref:hypothetical protein n=1 Tax=Haloarchaeobius sp. HRN-SO-5 TaxID=3446118 RepID=UPI003EB97A32
MTSVEIPSIVLQATDPVSNVTDVVEAFGQVVSNGDPLSILLLVVGGLLTAAALGAFGALTIGAVLSGIGRLISQEPPREGRAH